MLVIFRTILIYVPYVVENNFILSLLFVTRSVVDNLGVDADPVLAEPPEDPAAAPADEAEGAVFVPPAAVPAAPPDPLPLDILSELSLLIINMKRVPN